MPAGTPEQKLLADQLRRLEEQLLSPETRRSPDAASELIADDFVEFGSSGRVWNKQQILAALQVEPAARRVISDFHLRQLADDVALVTFRVSRHCSSTAAPVETLRSSVWKFNGRWEMVFHQGTPATETNNSAKAEQ